MRIAVLRRGAAVLAFAAAVAVLLGAATAARADDPVVPAVPVWKLSTYLSPGWDRSFKCDLVEEMSSAPRVVVFGGSRALRMDPGTIRKLTGLRAFNAAFHNGKPEDAWAFTNWLLSRKPDQPPNVIWCVQATTFADVPMAAGLILDQRLSQWFPPELIAAETARATSEPEHDLLHGRRYGADGMMLWNGYDTKRQKGNTIQRAIRHYLDPQMLAVAGNRQIPHHTRAQEYFEKTIELLNQHGVKPLIVIMPYQPTVLSKFLSVGWGAKERGLHRYLRAVSHRCDFKVLDLLHISTFGGNPDWFYDGAHLTAANSRLLIRYCVRQAPGCFRVSAVPPASARAVAPPAYRPVPEETAIPADQLE
ncbi:MAG TPA: hypothetical protein VFD50_02470 [Thermoleophilia bacterium]|nr:hypothetical protein [Thermoleophilia bacterium]